MYQLKTLLSSIVVDLGVCGSFSEICINPRNRPLNFCKFNSGRFFFKCCNDFAACCLLSLSIGSISLSNRVYEHSFQLVCFL